MHVKNLGFKYLALYYEHFNTQAQTRYIFLTTKIFLKKLERNNNLSVSVSYFGFFLNNIRLYISKMKKKYVVKYPSQSIHLISPKRILVVDFCVC